MFVKIPHWHHTALLPGLSPGLRMVVLHVKRAEESQFLYSCLVTDNVESVLLKVTLPRVSQCCSWYITSDCEHLQWAEEGEQTGRGGEGSRQAWGHDQARAAGWGQSHSTEIRLFLIFSMCSLLIIKYMSVYYNYWISQGCWLTK